MTQSQAQQDLTFIRQVMDESRSFATVGGNHFIIWGSVIGAALLGTWLRAAGMWRVSPMLIWLVCIGAGWLFTGLMVRRHAQLAGLTHPSGRMISGSWLALGFAMTLTFFLGTWNQSISIAAIPALSAAFTGVGIYINGMLARIDWLRNLAFVWWGSAASMLVWTGTYTYLLLAVLMLLLYVLPGILLNRMARRAAD